MKWERNRGGAECVEGSLDEVQVKRWPRAGTVLAVFLPLDPAIYPLICSAKPPPPCHGFPQRHLVHCCPSPSSNNDNKCRVSRLELEAGANLLIEHVVRTTVNRQPYSRKLVPKTGT